MYKWLKKYNSIYSALIWEQLKSDIISLLYIKQLRTCLIMTKAIIFEDHLLEYQPLKLEKYRQVFNKGYHLDIYLGEDTNLKIYQDKGKYYEEIPCIEIGEKQVWSIPLSLDNDKLSPCRMQKRFYLTPNYSVESENLTYWIGKFYAIY